MLVQGHSLRLLDEAWGSGISNTETRKPGQSANAESAQGLQSLQPSTEVPTRHWEQPKKIRRGCRVGHGKTAWRTAETPENIQNRCFSGVSAVLQAAVRLFYRDPLGTLFGCISADSLFSMSGWHLCRWPQRLQHRGVFSWVLIVQGFARYNTSLLAKHWPPTFLLIQVASASLSVITSIQRLPTLQEAASGTIASLGTAEPTSRDESREGTIPTEKIHTLIVFKGQLGEPFLGILISFTIFFFFHQILSVSSSFSSFRKSALKRANPALKQPNRHVKI